MEALTKNELQRMSFINYNQVFKLTSGSFSCQGSCRGNNKWFSIPHTLLYTDLGMFRRCRSSSLQRSDKWSHRSIRPLCSQLCNIQ